MNLNLAHKSINNKEPALKNCSLCNSTEQIILFNNIKDLEYESYVAVNYALCKNCRLIYQVPLPDKDLLSTFYPSNYRNYMVEKNNFFTSLKNIQFKNLAQTISKYVTSMDLKILEIGFGNGNLLLALKNIGYKNLYGIDFTDKTFQSLAGKGIQLMVSNAEDNIPFSESFDVIIMNNVIEHFLNPAAVLVNCKERLSKNGKIIFITPNGDALEFNLFKKYWAGFHAPRHIFIFDSKNIVSLGEKLGLKKIIVKPLTDPGQWSISIQNFLQDKKLTRTKLKNGMSWYLIFLSLIFLPVAMLQNWLGHSTSMFCIFSTDEVI